MKQSWETRYSDQSILFVYTVLSIVYAITIGWVFSLDVLSSQAEHG